MSSACASVFTAMNSTPLTPASTMRLTALRAAAADADDLDDCQVVGTCIEHVLPPPETGQSYYPKPQVDRYCTGGTLNLRINLTPSARGTATSTSRRAYPLRPQHDGRVHSVGGSSPRHVGRVDDADVDVDELLLLGAGSAGCSWSFLPISSALPDEDLDVVVQRERGLVDGGRRDTDLTFARSSGLSPATTASAFLQLVGVGHLPRRSARRPGRLVIDGKRPVSSALRRPSQWPSADTSHDVGAARIDHRDRRRARRSRS